MKPLFKNIYMLFYENSTLHWITFGITNFALVNIAQYYVSFV